MRSVLFICLVLFFAHFNASAQNAVPRKLQANRTSGTIKIDGILNDVAWKDAALMTDLIEFRPNVGKHENYANRTETYLMYNDEGIYFGGFCHERTRDSIATELKGRDGFGTNDYVGIIFDTYYDKLNGFEYFVTPLGDQWDAKMNPPSFDADMEDFTWNAVWESHAVITDSGWSFEMFIPLSAIRFGKKDVQDWGFNITRRRRKTEQQYTWNPIDPNVNGFLTQEGVWQGLSNIKPPIRLQFLPYLSLYANHYPYNTEGQKNWSQQVNGGMDLKYGINQAFTLDATLIPDFGQVQSDNRVLNLTPFEVKYNDYRPFFTEGTELFSKGNLFYSRRIGGAPLHLYDVYDGVDSNQTIVRNPTEAKLINATKISGRTQGGLGIGVLNAITQAEYATVEETGTKDQMKIQTGSLTNYNVFVLDQTLKNNSSVSLVNTSVWRSGKDYDANVTAGLFELNNKKNVYNVGGKFAVSNLVSYLPDGTTQTGFSHELHVQKTSGNFNFTLSEERADNRYNCNDLGYFTNNNYLNHYLWMGYHWIKPKNWYNRINLNFNNNLSFLAQKISPVDEKYQSAGFNVNANVQSKKLWYLGVFTGYSFRKNDFYEPRTPGWYFKRGATVDWSTWFESNNSKKYSYSAQVFARNGINFYDLFNMELSLYQSMRFNDHLSVALSIDYNPIWNSVGYTNVDGSDNINFARRDVNSVENILSAKYNFSNKMGITFRARHYVSTVDNKEFYLLQHDGSLLANTGFHPSVDENANYFNIDMVYTWEFAPGSFINIAWKNAAQYYSNFAEKKYFNNLSTTLDQNNNNNFSVKVIYFIDYYKITSSHNKKKQPDAQSRK